MSEPAKCTMCDARITMRGSKKFCSMRCYAMSYRKRGRAPFTIDRFLKFVSPEPNSGCWLWTGAASQYGYPFIQVAGRNRHAHREIVAELRGPIDPKLVVRHLCHNTFCVNPDHLTVGTHHDNVMDKVRASRQQRGEAVPNSRLTEADVSEIRTMRQAGVPRCVLAKNFAIGARHVSSICSKKSWGHVA